MAHRFHAAAIRSAWPTGAIDHLLRAATLPDLDAAAESWRAFEAKADFDALSWGEFRLISLTAPRIGRLAPASRFAARIVGIERAVWTRSQMTIGAVAPVLARLRAAGIDLLVVKGGARAASGDPAARGRIVNDIDVCVPPSDLAAAFDLATGAGWVPGGSGTVLFHRARLVDAVGINLVSGRYGNLDLHRTPFHSPFDRLEADADLWRRALDGRLGAAAVKIPGPTDTVSLAIAHGVHDAHKSSDWLVDIAHMIDRGVDWPLLEEILARRRLEPAAAVILAYVADRLRRPVPEAVLDHLARHARRHPLRLAAAIAEARPKARFGLFWLARLVAKQLRLVRVERRRRVRSRLVFPSPYRPKRAAATGATGLKAPIPLPGATPGRGWTGHLDLTLEVDLPPATRRVDFEINSATRHYRRLRAYVLNRGARRCVLRFRVAIAAEEAELILAAAPSRSFNTDAPEALRARYDPVPFHLLSVTARPAGA